MVQDQVQDIVFLKMLFFFGRRIDGSVHLNKGLLKK